MDIRKRALHSAVLTAILAGSLFLGTGEVEGLVLCLRHCGRVEVEESVHACCDDTCTSEDASKPGAAPEEHHHCVDFPLGGQRANVPLDSSVQVLPRTYSVLAGAIGESDLPGAGPLLGGAFARLPLPPPQLTALQTVVLLI